MIYNGWGYAQLGNRRATLSTDTKLDAGDNARKPLKPLLGIAVVGISLYFIYFIFN